ncbi:hypothetical protein H839_00730 [Parageobacillus genomosp. 1]|uniref:Uncharacterized protein n=1 Tax=Parageobacillus genomosp. 1 TaxID=1295642 RepID=A0ABC9VJZ2_9BACL|nr:hypothetical protein [Parageobacillus genomosp. 1]EZP79223.1 hypothetical protein H839_00730 [Parageobacillus genomosp. 1]
MIVLGVILLVLGVGLLIFAVYELREEWRQWKENENKKCIALLELLFLAVDPLDSLPFLLFFSLLFIAGGILLIL